MKSQLLKFAVLLIPLLVWALLYLLVRVLKIGLPDLRPWMGFCAVASIIVWIPLLALDSTYEAVPMLIVNSLVLGIWWMERRSKPAA